MTSITVLDLAAHAAIRAGGRQVPLGADRRFVEIAPREVTMAAITFPVMVTKNADSGAFLLGAVLGVDEGENLYLDQMNDGDVYRPLQLQREGFWIAQDQVAADLDHPRFKTGSGERLYDDEGSPTPFLQGVMEALKELRGGVSMSAVLLPRLVELGLLVPIDISLDFDDGSRRTLQDLYSIDQDALRTLDDAIVLDLFRRGYLQVVYLMIASLKNIPRLAKMKNERMGLPA
ncbi:MAG: SapC family protein [Janthinobacterium lividum]